MLQNKKYLLYAILALLAFNVWQWWPQGEKPSLSETQQTAGYSQIDELFLAAYATENEDINVVHRDLFHAKAAVPQAPRQEKQSVAKKKIIKTYKTSQRKYKKSQPRSSINGFRLIGVLFQNGEKNAYLINGDKDYTVKKGDRFGGRYLVKDVTVTSVTLLDSGSSKSSILSMK